MRNLLVTTVALLSAQAAAAATYTDRSVFDGVLAGLGVGSVVEGYEGVNTPLVLADGDSVGGISHSSSIGGNFELAVRDVLGNNELGVRDPTSGSETDLGFTDEVTFSFAPSAAFGFDFIVSVTELFDDEFTLSFAGETISSTARSTTSGDTLFFGIVTAGPAQSTATLSFSTDISLGGVDNVTLSEETGSATVVPLPASILMLIPALAGLGFVARRRRACA